MTQDTNAQVAIERFLAMLDLEEIELNIYRGQNESDRPGRLFGGQVAAQALAAAGRTVQDLPAHSFHGYFLRPGDPELPVVYTVDRIRDGRSFTTRRVVAQQHGKAIFNMSASFHAAEHGYSHQFVMPDVPMPEELMSRADYADKFIDRIPKAAARPDDPRLHQCALTYATDISLIDSIVQPHGRMGEYGPLMTASLDHAVWFHKPVRADEWVLYYQDSPSAFGARGLARGTIYTREGELVASTSQEALIRPAHAPEDRSE